VADPLTLLEQIDAVIYQHEQLQQWDAPESDGPIYPQQVERVRLFGPRIERAIARVEFDMVPDDDVVSLPPVGAGSTLVNQIRQATVRAISFGFRGVDHG
jgi:hypothetical protein